MDEEMEEFMFTAEPMVAEQFEVDFDYEFDAPQYYDFALPETPAKARETELWFDSAASYPPSRKQKRAKYLEIYRFIFADLFVVQVISFSERRLFQPLS